MKRGRKLTVAESNHVKSLGLTPANWLISKKQHEQWVIVNRTSQKPRTILAP